jgi:ribosomal-protein-alanine N-acetyltransferase
MPRSPKKLPCLETARLFLRPLEGSDLDALHALWTDRQVRKYLWDDGIISRERAAQEIRRSESDFDSHGYGQWGVFPLEAIGEPKTMIGFCGLRRFGDPPEVEVLYGLAPKYWGRGLATEAARAVLGFGFEQAGVQQVLAGADAPNIASFGVMQRLGMTYSRNEQVHGLTAVYFSLSRQAFQVPAEHYRVRWRVRGASPRERVAQSPSRG